MSRTVVGISEKLAEGCQFLSGSPGSIPLFFRSNFVSIVIPIKNSYLYNVFKLIFGLRLNIRRIWKVKCSKNFTLHCVIAL